jgi:hypothetical protein
MLVPIINNTQRMGNGLFSILLHGINHLVACNETAVLFPTTPSKIFKYFGIFFFMTHSCPAFKCLGVYGIFPGLLKDMYTFLPRA